jgi:hypothetical protein
MRYCLGAIVATYLTMPTGQNELLQRLGVLLAQQTRSVRQGVLGA